MGSPIRLDALFATDGQRVIDALVVGVSGDRCGREAASSHAPVAFPRMERMFVQALGRVLRDARAPVLRLLDGCPLAGVANRITGLATGSTCK